MSEARARRALAIRDYRKAETELELCLEKLLGDIKELGECSDDLYAEVEEFREKRDAAGGDAR